jgi:alanyl-tRNA synthetase
MIVVAVTKSAEQLGAHAGNLVKLASSVLGGGGGGKPDMAQGGGVDASKVDSAIEAMELSLGA